MEIISDTNINGRRRVVARYTAEERAAMEERAAAHKAEMDRLRAEMEAAHQTKENT